MLTALMHRIPRDPSIHHHRALTPQTWHMRHEAHACREHPARPTHPAMTMKKSRRFQVSPR